MFAYCNNNPVNLADSSGHAAGWTNLSYDKGGGYYFYVPQHEPGSKEDELLEKHLPTLLGQWGSNRPANSIMLVHKIDEEYARCHFSMNLEDFVLGELGAVLGAKIAKIFPSKPAKIIGPVVGYMAGKLLSDVIGTGIPAGTYDLYAVTSIERYRQVDSYTGQFVGWYTVVNTTYYIDLVIGNQSEWYRVRYS